MQENIELAKGKIVHTEVKSFSRIMSGSGLPENFAQQVPCVVFKAHVSSLLYSRARDQR